MKKKATNIPFGLHKETMKLVHIKDLNPAKDRGLSAQCICPHCKSNLVARFPNSDPNFTSHFAHYNLQNCTMAFETAIHMKAKEIIEEEKQLVLPELIVEYKNIHGTVVEESLFYFDEIKNEVRLGDIQSDLIAIKSNRQLFIEIYVTHKVDLDKKKKLEKIGVSTVQIDLSNLYGRKELWTDTQFLRHVLIEKVENKKWIYNARVEEQLRQMKAKYEKIQRELEKIKVKEKRLKQKEVEREQKRIAEKEKLVVHLLDSNYQENERSKWRKQITSDNIWTKHSKELGITISNLPKYINVEVDGDFVMGCDRLVWQTYILNRFVIQPSKKYEDPYPVDARVIIKNIKTYFKKRLVWDLTYLKDTSFNLTPDLVDVIYEYLCTLEEAGFLSKSERSGHPYYQKFIVIKDWL